eukprot:gnl/TRDRNA2_/TRDRNA2_83144_c0_seq1.p1 gnl/TRDRNA2_/TRDRNA2_83144_c0~~gnl/TRDRNA2_/TRDRNA2_83144_c0_seq1.p1  ORF type:complete len:325 (+),score=40.31 gnl/TRDRNA2_/TRDRNA2_83144_c0_seq1:36-1010(+)
MTEVRRRASIVLALTCGSFGLRVVPPYTPDGVAIDALYGVRQQVEQANQTETNAALKVKADVYGEAGCPDCHGLLMNAIAFALTRPNIDNILELNYVPFGNAYFKMVDSSPCGGTYADYENTWGQGRLQWSGYDASVRDCWDQHCGKESANPPEGCFHQGPFCQHGKVECHVNLVQGCAKTLEPNYLRHMPFVLCIERAYDSIAGAVSETDASARTVAAIDSCSAATGIDEAAVKQCMSNPATAHAVNEAMAKATPSHPGTPHILLTNTSGVAFALPDPDSIPTADEQIFFLRAVCNAHKYNQVNCKNPPCASSPFTSTACTGL